MATLMRVDWIGKREGNPWIVWMQERLEEELEIANIVNIFKCLLEMWTEKWRSHWKGDQGQ